MIESGKITQQQKEAMQKLNSHMFHKSNFSFLNQQNGWRDGELHTLLGTAGSGKSTFIRSIIYDFLLNNRDKKILIYLSEESAQEFRLQFSYTDALEPMTERILLFSEMTASEKDKYETRIVNGKPKEVFVLYEKFFKEADRLRPDIILIDNFTTSQGYQDVKVSEQGKVIGKIKRKALELACPIIAVVHANKNVSRYHARLIDDTDVRGSATIGNNAQFFYSIQRFTDKNTDSFMSFLNVTKFRNQQMENYFFQLVFSKHKRIFAKDVPLKYSQILESLNNAAR